MVMKLQTEYISEIGLVSNETCYLEVDKQINFLHQSKNINTEQCHCNMVNILTNPHNRQAIARPWRGVMGCLLWL